jgi:hypothetical protein
MIFRRVLAMYAAVICSSLLSNCTLADKIMGTQISVVFTDTRGAGQGSRVYMAGVLVGTVSDSRVERGTATLLVTVDSKHKDAIPEGTIFLVTEDPQNGRKPCLVGFTAKNSPIPEKPKEIFYGATNRIELIKLMGPRRAGEFIEGALNDVIDGTIKQLSP